MNPAYQARMRALWQDPAYREKMLAALAKGREVYVNNSRLVAETAHRSSRTKINAGARCTQSSSLSTDTSSPDNRVV